MGQERVAADIALHHIGAVLDGPAYSGANLVRPVRDESQPFHAEPEVGGIPVGHAPGGADVPAGREEPRAGIEPLVDGLLQGRIDAVHRPRRPCRRVAAGEGQLRVPRRLEGGVLGRTVQVEVGDDLDVVVREMDMRLDQPGDHRPPAQVHRLHVGASGLIAGRERSHVDEGVPLDDQRGARPGRRTCTVYEPEVLEVEAHGWPLS
jgi:hypothetical protein